MNITQKRLLAAALAAVVACVQPAAAQWAWRDAAGKMVYSDQPPPKSVPSKDIVRQPQVPPASRQTAVEAPQSEAATDAKPSSAAAQPPARPRAPTLIEREMDSRRRQVELAEAEKKAADEEALRAKLAADCERMRGYLRALEGGFRVARVNAAGQQEILDDAARAAERERTRSEIEQQCQ
jgi:Domain of unknown function (DUF4124)